MKRISALIFVKKNSERIPGKNFRAFNGRPLFSVILDKLNSMNLFEHIIVDSDSEEILQFVAEKINSGKPVVRPGYLHGGHISGNDLLTYNLQFAESEHIFQTHCTNPLLTEKTIIAAIKNYFDSLDKYDSLFSVTRIQNRAFFPDGKPVNHTHGKLLPTQELSPLYVENASFFIFSKTSFRKSGNNRVGLRPKMFEISPVEGIDIDYEHEFRLAELVEKNKDYFPFVF